MTPLATPERAILTFFYLGTPASVGIARKAAGRTALAWGLGASKAENVELVVSELVTNAVEAAGHGEIQVTLSAGGQGRIAIEVRDQSPNVPTVMRPGLLDEQGRGLMIVEILSVRCGVHWDHGRKVVFAVL
ncbi:ATP-binding protein [Actinomadura madurae]|uniref:ATP-binding protein n=1 Tax=Actinomadura madurae TaxID=1993 RepID=UPI00399A68D6